MRGIIIKTDMRERIRKRKGCKKQQNSMLESDITEFHITFLQSELHNSFYLESCWVYWSN